MSVKKRKVKLLLKQIFKEWLYLRTIFHQITVLHKTFHLGIIPHLVMLTNTSKMLCLQRNSFNETFFIPKNSQNWMENRRKTHYSINIHKNPRVNRWKSLVLRESQFKYHSFITLGYFRDINIVQFKNSDKEVSKAVLTDQKTLS